MIDFLLNKLDILYFLGVDGEGISSFFSISYELYESIVTFIKKHNIFTHS